VIALVAALSAGFYLIPVLFVPRGDFQLVSDKSTIVLSVNQSRNIIFGVRSLERFSGIVRFAVQAPPKVNATVGPAVEVRYDLLYDPVINQIADMGSSFTVTSTRSGNYTVLITGTSGNKSHSISYFLIVRGMSFTANPDPLYIPQRSSGNMIITMHSLNGYSGNLTVQASAGILWITLISTTLNCNICTGTGALYPLSPNGTVGVIVNIQWQSNGANNPGNINTFHLSINNGDLRSQEFTIIFT
jgi:hypothetical protein